MKFDDLEWDEFLFSTSFGRMWMIMTKEEIFSERFELKYKNYNLIVFIEF